MDHIQFITGLTPQIEPPCKSLILYYTFIYMYIYIVYPAECVKCFSFIKMAFLRAYICIICVV